MTRVQVYWSAPHRFTQLNERVRQSALQAGIDVFIPGDIGGDNTSLAVREACIRALSTAEMVLVSLDCYGMDTAWEIGFAAGREIATLGVVADEATLRSEHHVRIGTVHDHWMHDWERKSIASSRDDLLRLLREKRFASLYVSSSTKDLARGDAVASVLAGAAPRSVVTARELVRGFEKLPRAEYPPIVRDRCTSALRAADAIVVDVMDLGMNSSWEIGFADALAIPVIGVAFLPPPSEKKSRLYLADYWTHGWTGDNIVHGLEEAFARAARIARSAAGPACAARSSTSSGR